MSNNAHQNHYNNIDKLLLKANDNTEANAAHINTLNGRKVRSQSRGGPSRGRETTSPNSSTTVSPNRAISTNRLRSRSRGRSTGRHHANGSNAPPSSAEVDNWRWAILKSDPSNRFVEVKKNSTTSAALVNSESPDTNDVEESEEEHVDADVDGYLYYDVHDIVLPNFQKSIKDMYKMASSAATICSLEEEEEEEDHHIHEQNRFTMEVKSSELTVTDSPYVSVSRSLSISQQPLPPNYKDTREYSEVKKYLMVVDASEESQGSIQYVLGSVVKSGDVLYLIHCVNSNDTSSESLSTSNSVIFQPMGQSLSMTEALVEQQDQQKHPQTNTLSKTLPHVKTVDALSRHIKNTITAHPLNIHYNPLSITSDVEPFNLTVIIQSISDPFPKHMFNNYCKFIKPELFIAHYKFLGRPKKPTKKLRSYSRGSSDKPTLKNGKLTAASATRVNGANDDVNGVKPLLEQFMPDAPLLVLIRRRKDEYLSFDLSKRNSLNITDTLSG